MYPGLFSKNLLRKLNLKYNKYREELWTNIWSSSKGLPHNLINPIGSPFISHTTSLINPITNDHSLQNLIIQTLQGPILQCQEWTVPTQSTVQVIMSWIALGENQDIMVFFQDLPHETDIDFSISIKIIIQISNVKFKIIYLLINFPIIYKYNQKRKFLKRCIFSNP